MLGNSVWDASLGSVGSRWGLIFGPWIFWALLKVLGFFFCFDFCPNSIIPVTRNPEYPPPPPHRPHTPGIVGIDSCFALVLSARDTAGWLIEHRKLTLPLRPWKIVSVFSEWFTSTTSICRLFSGVE